MFLTNLVYLFHIVFHCILLFVSVAHRDLTVYALINMALLLLLLLCSNRLLTKIIWPIIYRLINAHLLFRVK